MKIIHISDLHLNAIGSDNSIEKVEFLFRHLARQDFDHLVITGDSTENGTDEEFGILRELLAEYDFLDSHVTTAIIGNHDIFGGVHKAEDILTFPERCKQVDFSGRLQQFHLSVPELFEHCVFPGNKKMYPFCKTIQDTAICSLNSIIPYSSFKNPFASNGEIDDEQFSALHEMLLEAQDQCERFIIAIHHHCNKIQSENQAWIKSVWTSIEKQTMKMRKKKRLFSLFKAFQVSAVLHGHVHVSEQYERSGIRFYNAGGSVHNHLHNTLQFNELVFENNIPECTIRQIPFSSSRRKYVSPYKHKEQILLIA